MITINIDKPIKGIHNEVGPHRIMRVPPTETRGRVHTSIVTVAVIDTAIAAPTFPDSDFEVRFHRSTGKGGQRKNKVATCCVITHLPTGITQKADGRSRDDNEQLAKKLIIEKLTSMHTSSALDKSNTKRQGQIGDGARGNQRRTYRFADDNIIDHLTGKSTSCKMFFRGNIEKLW